MYGEFPPHVIELITRQLASLGRIGSTKIYITPEIVTPIPIFPSADSQPPPLRFREPGVVIGCYGQAIATAAGVDTADAVAFATTRLQVLIGGTDSLFTNGQAQAFVPMLALFGGPSNWFPLWREARPGVDWTVAYQNRSATHTKRPDFMLAFIGYADLARHGVPPGQLPPGAGAPHTRPSTQGG